MDASGFLLILITGLMVIALSYALDRIWAAAIPVRMLYLLIRAPGVVLHECSHIIGCLVTGARIHSIVFFSPEGGSVTYSRPALPLIGDVVIGTAPLFLLPLVLSFITWVFSTFFGCIFPVFPATIESPAALVDLGRSILGTFPDNLLTRFNAWILLFLYLTVSLVLSAAPSTRDMKNAAAGGILLIVAGVLVLGSGIPPAVTFLDGLVRLLGYGFTLGLVYGLVAFTASIPLVAWYLYTRRS